MGTRAPAAAASSGFSDVPSVETLVVAAEPARAAPPAGPSAPSSSLSESVKSSSSDEDPESSSSAASGIHPDLTPAPLPPLPDPPPRAGPPAPAPVPLEGGSLVGLGITGGGLPRFGRERGKGGDAEGTRVPALVFVGGVPAAFVEDPGPVAEEVSSDASAEPPPQSESRTTGTKSNGISHCEAPVCHTQHISHEADTRTNQDKRMKPCILPIRPHTQHLERLH